MASSNSPSQYCFFLFNLLNSKEKNVADALLPVSLLGHSQEVLFCLAHYWKSIGNFFTSSFQKREKERLGRRTRMRNSVRKISFDNQHKSSWRKKSWNDIDDNKYQRHPSATLVVPLEKPSKKNFKSITTLGGGETDRSTKFLNNDARG